MSIRRKADSWVAVFFEGLTGIGCIVAVYLLWKALWTENLAAAAVTAAIGIGCAVIPYCLAGVAHRSAERSRWND